MSRPTSRARRPHRVRIAVQDLEARLVPSAPAAPPGFTATTTSHTNNTDVVIPANQVVTLTSTIAVAGAGMFVHDIDVATFLMHTYAEDVLLSLTSPAGTTVTLTTYNGFGEDNVFNGTLWDDDADPGNPLGSANRRVTDTGYSNNVVETTLTPEEALGAFRGENPNGNWTLTVHDPVNLDGGLLDAWSLLVTTLNAAPPSFAVDTASSAATLPFAGNSTPVTSTIEVSGQGTYINGLTATTFIDQFGSLGMTATLTSPAGTTVTLTSRNGMSDAFNGTVWNDDADPGNQVPYGGATSLLATDTNYTGALEPTLVPEEPLSAFVGEDPNGTWTLTVSDISGFGGSVNGWSLAIRDNAPPPAGTFTVTNAADAGPGSLRAAVQASIDSPGDDTILFDPVAFAAPRVIELASPLPSLSNGNATIVGPGAALLTIDANGVGRTLESVNPAFSLSGVTLTGGSHAAGGALRTAGAATLTDVVVTGNSAGAGGGIHASVGPLTLVDSVISGNTANAGGGVFAYPGLDLTLLRSVVSGNQAAGAGGGVYAVNATSVTVRDSVVSGNTSVGGPGGGLATANAAVLLERSTLSGNAARAGGGLHQTNGPLTVTASTISGNTSTGTSNTENGGGIAVLGGAPVTIRHSTIAGNTSNVGGGGIGFLGGSGTALIANTTVTGNSAATPTADNGGGGILMHFTTRTVTLVNSIVAGNTHPSSPDIREQSGDLTSSFSAIGSAAGFTDSNGANNVPFGANLLLGPLQDNGGPTLTRAPLAGSPLIDAGNTNAVATPVDQVGRDRVFGVAVDIGSFEVQPAVTTIALAAGQPSLTNSSVTFDIRFDAAVTGFTTSDLGILTDFGGAYIATLTDLGGGDFGLVLDNFDAGFAGTFTVSVPAGVADGSGQPNLASGSAVVEVDTLAPTVTINEAATQDDPGRDPVRFDVLFSEPVFGFGFDDVAVSFNGDPVNPANVQVDGSGADYTVTVSGLVGEGVVVADLPSLSAFDAAGNGSEASTWTDNEIFLDALAPTATVAPVADPASGNQAQFTVSFSEPVFGFTAADVDLSTSTTGGTLAAEVSGSGTTYTVTVTGMAGSGAVVADISQAVLFDAAGNGLGGLSGTDTVAFIDSGLVAFSQSTYTASEDGGLLTITVVRTGGTEAMTVDYATSPGTATALDYGPTAGTLTWAAGDTTPRTFTIDISPDDLDEPLETFDLTLSNPSIPGALGVHSTATVEIADFETGVVELSTSAYSAVEGATAIIVVNRTDGGDGPLTLTYTITPDALGASAADFNGALVGGVNFADGDTDPKYIFLPIVDDSLNEGSESFTIAISGAPLGATAFAAVTIAPSDGAVSGVVTDDDGDTVSVKVKKGGAAEVFLFDPDGDGVGPIDLVRLSGTTAASTVAIAGKGGDGIVRVGDIEGGALKSIVGKKAVLTGGLTLAGDVAAVTFAEFGPDAAITAGSIGKLTTVGNKKAGIAGDFGADAALDGLGTLKVKGSIIDADIDVAGSIGSITAGGFASSHVAADTITKVVLKSLETDNGGVAFGFTVDTALNSLKAGKPVTFTYTPADGPSKTEGDFSVTVI